MPPCEPVRVARAALQRPAAKSSLNASTTQIELLSPVAIYIGYFGAAAGVMLLAILSLGEHGDFRSVNALKNLLGGAMSIVAITIFVVSGLVDWPHAIVMGIGGVIGGYTGGRMVRFIPTRLMSNLVIGVGCIVTAIYARRYWFGG